MFCIREVLLGRSDPVNRNQQCVLHETKRLFRLVMLRLVVTVLRYRGIHSRILVLPIVIP